MGASSVTGSGQGAADKNSPTKIKYDRLVGPFGTRILMSGSAFITGGEVIVEHPFLNAELENVARLAISNSAFPVWVSSYNDNLFTVNSQETSRFNFVWMIIETGVSASLPS